MLVSTMPMEENVMAPIAHPESGVKYTSGIEMHSVRRVLGNVPSGHGKHCVSSSGFRI